VFSFPVAVAALLLAQPAAERVVVTATPPLDSQRLADALGAYLAEFGIGVEVGPASPDGDVRAELAGARALGESFRAVAVIRAERGAPGAVDIQIVDLATEKALLATVPRPARDEDLYRALALKIQAILRATLSEASARLPPDSSLGRLVATPAPAPSAVPRAIGLAAGYALLSFPIGGHSFGGVAITATHAPRPWLELAIAGAALGGARAAAGDVDVTVDLVPFAATARLRRATARFELLGGPSLQAAIVSASPTSATTPVRASRSLMFGVGAEVEARVRIVAPAWLYARAGALGILDGERYGVSGAPVFDVSRLQLAGGAGLAVQWP
jgi:hypothetical protein